MCTKCEKEKSVIPTSRIVFELIVPRFVFNSLVTEMKFKTEYPELEKSILDLIPHTNGMSSSS